MVGTLLTCSILSLPHNFYRNKKTGDRDRIKLVDCIFVVIKSFSVLSVICFLYSFQQHGWQEQSNSLMTSAVGYMEFGLERVYLD